jgi:hypothetical protein
MSRKINTLLGTAALIAGITMSSAPIASAESPSCISVGGKTICTLPENSLSPATSGLLATEQLKINSRIEYDRQHPESRPTLELGPDFEFPSGTSKVVTTDGNEYGFFSTQRDPNEPSEIWGVMKTPDGKYGLPFPVSRTSGPDFAPKAQVIPGSETKNGKDLIIIAYRTDNETSDPKYPLLSVLQISAFSHDLNESYPLPSSYPAENSAGVISVDDFVVASDPLNSKNPNPVYEVSYTAQTGYGILHLKRNYNPQTQEWSLPYYYKINNRTYLPNISTDTKENSNLQLSNDRQRWPEIQQRAQDLNQTQAQKAKNPRR